MALTARRLFWAGAFIFVGALLLVSNLGYLHPFRVWALWPVLVLWPALRLAFGRAFVAVVDHGPDGEYIRVGRGLGLRLVALWVAAGAAAQLAANLGLTTRGWSFVAVWSLPVLLVGLGVVILAHPRGLGCPGGWCAAGRTHRGWEWSGRGYPAGERKVYAFAGDIELGREPWDFKSPMVVDVWAGDIALDLTTARLGAGENVLYVSAWAADVDITVPADLEVSAEVAVRAGEIDVLGRRRSGLGIQVKVDRPASSSGAGSPATGSEEAAEPSAAHSGDPSDRPRLRIKVGLGFGDVRITCGCG